MKLYIQAFLLFMLITCQQANAGIVLIMHKQSAINQLKAETIKELYLGLRQYVQKIRILPLDQDVGERSRQSFYHDLIKKPQSQLISHWSRLIFTGKGQAPVALSSDQSILMFVSNNPNVVGYIDERFLTDDVKVVFRLE